MSTIIVQSVPCDDEYGEYAGITNGLGLGETHMRVGV